MKVGDLGRLRTFKNVYPDGHPRLAIVLGMHTSHSGHVVGVTVMWDKGSVSTLATPDFLEIVND